MEILVESVLAASLYLAAGAWVSTWLEYRLSMSLFGEDAREDIAILTRCDTWLVALAWPVVAGCLCIAAKMAWNEYRIYGATRLLLAHMTLLPARLLVSIPLAGLNTLTRWRLYPGHENTSRDPLSRHRH